jgi:predicted AAA+ superfamily ATPase
MLKRICNIPKSNSFFLLGPRATGKTSLLRIMLPDAVFVDLLDPKIYERYLENPSELSEFVNGLAPNCETVVIDEIQRVPLLLDVVQKLMGETKIQFVLTGSSARKLKRGQANLLGGRAFIRYLWPLSILELPSEFDDLEKLRWGGLPLAALAQSNEHKQEFLRSYIRTYLNEEIVAEQLVRNLQPFRKFLKVAAQMSGHIVNFAKIGRDIGTSHNTVQSYYEILEDTLIGFSLPAFETSERKRLRNKNKFYLFDTGVTLALSRRLEDDLNTETSHFGAIFEQCVVTEIKALSSYLKPDWELFYLQTASGTEIDLLIDTGVSDPILIEIKSTDRIHAIDLQSELKLLNDIPSKSKYVFSRDPISRTLADGTQCLPWKTGLRILFGLPN